MKLKELHQTDTYEGTPSTTKILEDMLKENTGRHMLDSGSHYGRHFEENRKVEDMDNTPISTHSIRNYGEDEIELISHVSTYHFLKHRVDYTNESHQLTKQFYEYSHEEALDGESWTTCMDALFGNASVNTYNHEHAVDQVLQFHAFTLEGVGYDTERDPRPEDCEFVVGDRIVRAEPDIHGDFVALQIHNGCDVRGGYTAPVVFECPHGADYMVMSPTTDISCSECGWVASQYDGGRSRDGDWSMLRYDEEADLLLHEECGGSECEVSSFVSV